MPDSAQTLIDKAFADFDGAVVDQRIDVLADGQLGSAVVDEGAQADIEAALPESPLAWARRKAVRHAAGMGHGAFADAEYVSRLRIELGEVLSGGRLTSVLTPLLQHPQFFERMRYASGYPDPALARAIDPDRLAEQDFIDPALVEPLRAIYDVNPLLFALVTRRNVRLATTGLGFPASVFTAGNGS